MASGFDALQKDDADNSGMNVVELERLSNCFHLDSRMLGVLEVKGQGGSGLIFGFSLDLRKAVGSKRELGLKVKWTPS